ncbi:bifunctional diaminohydroxyphosphoribosylaminopyrimidine deaminase/5-amino-6-(5-phosphoribosylamino)uracil reductase RibD [Mucilaginibacter sp.]
MQVDEIYMRRCLELAALGAGQVSPNPMVGAVIVYQNTIIGEGYHQQYGKAHAEVNAVNDVLSNFENAGELLEQSTIYVSLEPCAHYGKTPPCADLIIKRRIPRVVAGCRDPFDAVNGRGIEKLEQAGIQVTVGVLAHECRQLNKRFFTRVTKHRPYIILKWAQTADGCFAPANGRQHWITNDTSRRLVHQWRSEEAAILVGKNTALTDNPQLNVRYGQGKNPKRVVIDRRLELPSDLHIFNSEADTFVFNEVKTDVEGNVKYIALEDFDRYVPQYIAYQLYLQDVQSLIVEGGAATLNSFIEAGLWDEARVFTGASLLQGGIMAPRISGNCLEEHQVGTDRLQIFYHDALF